MKKSLNNFEKQAIINAQVIKGGTSGRSLTFRERTGKSARIREKRTYA